MAEDTFLGDDFLRQLMSVGEVDLLVGIPSHNNAYSIGQVIQTVEDTYRQNFVRDRVVILNVDGGSTDDTCELALQAHEQKNIAHKGITTLRTVHRVIWQYAKSPSLGTAVRTILTAADLLRARACAVVSPTTTNLSPTWIANLLRPAYRDSFDFVAPLYARSKYQGLLVRELLYPMSRAIFGHRLREMYADDFAFSGSLASRCLEQEIWREEAAMARPEGWMAACAMSANRKVCQSFLGQRIRSPQAPTPDIVDAIRQAVGNLFWCAEIDQDTWIGRTGSEPVPTFGPDHELLPEDPPSGQDKMLDLFRSGVNELEPVLTPILTAETYAEIKRIAGLDPRAFSFGDDLWVRTLYEFAAAYHHTVLNRDHIVQALVPLYRGRIYSFLFRHVNSSADEMEAATEALCVEFETQKSYLVEKWNANVEVKS